MRLILLLFFCFFSSGYLAMSSIDSSYSTKLTLVDSVSPYTYVNINLGKWIVCNKDRLGVCGVLMGNFYVSVNDLKTKTTNGFTSQFPNEEYIAKAFEYKDKIYVQSVVVQSDSKKTCLIRTFNRNTVELLSSEVCLTSVPKDDFEIKDMYKDEKVKVAAPGNSVFYIDPKGIDKVSDVVSEVSEDQSKLLCGFIARNDDDNHNFFAKITDFNTGKIEEINLQLGNSRINPKYLDGVSAKVLNNGEVLFFLKDYPDGDFNGYTVYRLKNGETKKVSVKMSDFIKSEEDFKFVSAEYRISDPQASSITLYLYLDEDGRKVVAKIKIDMEKEIVTSGQSIRLNPDIEGEFFRVYEEDGKDEILVIQDAEAVKREISTLSIGGVGFGNSMNLALFKNKDYYVVNVGKDFKKKWEVAGTYEKLDTKEFLPLEIERAGKNIAVRVYKKSGLDREIWDAETGKSLDTKSIGLCSGEDFYKIDVRRVDHHYLVFSGSKLLIYKIN